jgi:tetrahydromethanopterin S-methyltransferase subunit G
MIDEVVLSIIGLAVTVVGMLGGALYWLGRKFGEIDKRFEEIDKRFEEIDRRFEEVNKRFEEMERRFTVFADSVRSAVVAMNSAVIEFLGIKGLISLSEVSFLINEVARISQSIRANPISKEEVEFIRSVFAKGDIDKISVEELERVAEIAKRWWYEDGSEVAYKLFIYVWMLRAYKLYSKKGQEK